MQREETNVTKRAVLYARVSGDDRGKDGRNIEGQLNMCREYALDNGWTVVEELAEDVRGASGADMYLPKLTQALEMARSGEFDLLVVREIDRFARLVEKQLIVEGDFKRAGVQIEYVLGDYPDTPEGRLNKMIKASIAEYERTKIAERTARARYNFVRHGNVLCHGRPPYGYRLAEKNGKRTLEIYEPEARIVRMMFEWYASGEMSLYAICRRLAELGIPTPRYGNNRWHENSVYVMLSSETYAGTWHYHKKTVTDKGKTVRVPKSQHIPVEVPAIVSRETWELVQERFQESRDKAKRNARYSGLYLFRRRVTCGRCRKKMTSATRKRKRKQGPKLDAYYHCSRRYRLATSGCTQKTYFRADQIDPVVWEWIKSWFSSRQLLSAALKEYQKEIMKETAPLRERMTVIEDLLADNREQLERLLDLYLAGEFPKDILIGRRQRLEKTIAALDREHRQLAASLEMQTLTDEQVQSLEQFADKVSQGFEYAEDNFEERRRIVDMLDVQIELDYRDEGIIIDAECRLGKKVVSLGSTSSGIG
jgi:site-specific DNA recombinase